MPLVHLWMRLGQSRGVRQALGPPLHPQARAALPWGSGHNAFEKEVPGASVSVKEMHRLGKCAEFLELLSLGACRI